MRPRLLWLTSTLSTLSRLISNVRRLMKPVLWTTRMLVTSVSVVQRWKQAFAVQYSATIATTAEADRHNRAMPSVVVWRDRKKGKMATVQVAIAGTQTIQRALFEYRSF